MCQSNNSSDDLTLDIINSIDDQIDIIENLGL